jgi:hypothetical protein
VQASRAGRPRAVVEGIAQSLSLLLDALFSVISLGSGFDTFAGFSNFSENALMAAADTQL